MLLTPRAFVRFIDGRLGSVQRIAFLPGEYSALLNAISCDVLINRNYAIKLKEKHQLKYEHFQLIQPAIDEGYVLRDGRDLCFIFIEDRIFRSHFLLIIKQANKGTELWLKSFYRIKPDQTKRLLKKAEIIRMHYQEETAQS